LLKWNDANSGEKIGYVEMQQFLLRDDMRAAAWSPDGKWLIVITSNPDNYVIRNLAESRDGVEAVLQAAMEKRNISAADFSPDGKLLVTGSMQGQALLWSLDNPSQQPQSFSHTSNQGGTERIFSVAFNPNSKKEQFVTVSFDNVRLWSSKVGPDEQNAIFLPDSPRDRIIRAAFSRDGKKLITGTMTGAAQIWDPAGKTKDENGKTFLKEPLGQPVWHLGTAGIGPAAFVGFSPSGDGFVTCVGPAFNKPDSLRFWSIPSALPSYVKTGASKRRAPDWLPELAEAVSGLRLTPHGYELTPAESSLRQVEKKIPASSK
jgi:WD40 repeat protein